MAAKSTSTKKIKRPKPPKSDKKGSAASTELASARATIKKLKASVRVLEKNVAKAESKADALKTELKKLRAEAVTKVKKAKSGSTAKIKKTKKPVDAIAEHAEPAAAPTPEPVPEPAPVEEAPISELTVAQLRALAREQGVPGYSRMRKDQLIAALS